MRRYYWLIVGLTLLLLFLPGCRGTPAGQGDDPDPVPGQPQEEPDEEPEPVEDADDAEEDGDGGAEGEDGEEPVRNDLQLLVSGDKLAVRKTPGSQNKPGDDVLTRLKQEQKVYLQDHHDNQVKVDGLVWWEIYDSSSQAKGWCAAKYLTYLPAQRTGIIEGSITFPASEIPDGLTVVAEEVDTGQEYKTQEVLYSTIYRFGVGFLIRVPPGNYHIYAVDPDFDDFRAYYDEHLKSDFTLDSLEKIVVSIQDGQHVDNIIVGNWWTAD